MFHRTPTHNPRQDHSMPRPNPLRMQHPIRHPTPNSMPHRDPRKNQWKILGEADAHRDLNGVITTVYHYLRDPPLYELAFMVVFFLGC